MTSCIASIVFNTDRFIKKQWELYRKFTDAHFIIVDNSTDEAISERLYKFAKENHIRYIRTIFEERDFSRSHGLACNRAYFHLHKEYELIFFSDHDLFLVQPFNISELMKDKVIAGVPQIKNDITYLWAGLVIINNRLIDRNALDFMPSQNEQLDTGGELSKIFRHLPKDKYHLFAERPQEEKTNIFIDVEENENPLFIHLRNGSDWKKETGYEERIGRLLDSLP